MTRLQDLLMAAGVEPELLGGVEGFDPEDTEFTRLVEDSRQIEPGDAFVEMPSDRAPSWKYIADARARGAVLVLASSAEGLEEAGKQGLPAVLVGGNSASFQDALWRLARAAFDDPSTSFRLIGVTGTNGKTTTCKILRDALQAGGEVAGYLGTLGFELPDREVPLANTTPFTLELNRCMRLAADSGVTALAMEVSSHALAERRADGLAFDVGIFTNLTQDHLDYHGTMAEYAAAKRRLFTDLPALAEKRFRACLNVDDLVGAEWATQLPDALTFGLQRGDLRATPKDVRFDRVRMEVSEGNHVHVLQAPLGGEFNVQNLLAACAGLRGLGWSAGEACEALGFARPVPGRFESVPNDSGIGVLVDYAHTPDALEKLLVAARGLVSGKLWVVFGCGGDRDRTKRPKMGAVASKHADMTILTSDNPRTEDPLAILREIEAGIEAGAAFESISDRQEAVARALRLAEPGDLVVLAGKGHENYQIVGAERFPMDDRELARRGLEARA